MVFWLCWCLSYLRSTPERTVVKLVGGHFECMLTLAIYSRLGSFSYVIHPTIMQHSANFGAFLTERAPKCLLAVGPVVIIMTRYV